MNRLPQKSPAVLNGMALDQHGGTSLAPAVGTVSTCQEQEGGVLRPGRRHPPAKQSPEMMPVCSRSPLPVSICELCPGPGAHATESPGSIFRFW